MKANELRIGNWLQRLDGTFFQVVSSDFSIIENTPTYLTPKPIPITEEWLLKFGFEKDGNRFSIGDFEIEKQGLKYACALWDESAPHLTTFIGHHRYVHQLQNLYFALTGEEITIEKP